jgi:MerR family transcriptional regulator, light-induced transcriptional regulator
VTEPPPAGDSRPVVLDRLRVRLGRALERLNAQGADNALDELFAFGTEVALSEVILPCLEELEERWGRRGDLEHEHFAHGLLEQRLLSLASGWERGGRRTAVIACPPLETNPIYAIACALVLRRRGWRIAYLGASSPVRHTRAVAAQVGADAVVVAAGDATHFRGSRLALARMAARYTLVITGRGAEPDVGAGVAGALLRTDPVAAAIEVDGLVFTPAG